MEREEMGTEISHNPISLRRQEEKKTIKRQRTTSVPLMWSFVKGEWPRNRLLRRKLSRPPSSLPLARPHSFILPRWTRVYLRTLGHARKLETSRGAAARGRGGRGAEGQRKRFVSINEEEEANEEAGEERTATATTRMRNRTDGETWSTLCLWSSGEGERPSMWRTCRLLPSRPRSAAGRTSTGRYRGARSRRRRDSRHAKSGMPTGRAVCDRGFRAMEIGESWATIAKRAPGFLGFLAARERRSPKPWLGSAWLGIARTEESRSLPESLDPREAIMRDFEMILYIISHVSRIWSRSQHCPLVEAPRSVVALRIEADGIQIAIIDGNYVCELRLVLITPGVREDP